MRNSQSSRAGIGSVPSGPVAGCRHNREEKHNAHKHKRPSECHRGATGFRRSLRERLTSLASIRSRSASGWNGQLEGGSADAFVERVRGRLHKIAQDLSDALYWFDAAIAPSQMARVGNLHELLIDTINGKPDGTTHAERERKLAALFPRPPAEAGNAKTVLKPAPLLCAVGLTALAVVAVALLQRALADNALRTEHVAHA